MARLLDELGHEVIERDPRYGTAALEITQTYLRAIHESLSELPDPSLAERSTRQMAAAGGALVPAFRRDALRRKRPAYHREDRVTVERRRRPADAGPGSYGAACGRWAWPSGADRVPDGRELHAMDADLQSDRSARDHDSGRNRLDGLPLCVQLAGRHGAEDLLYSLASQIETAQPWAQRRPPGV